MVLDSQCLQHLEIVESSDGKREGSLLHFIDHCSTPFGRRQLKRWLLAPLMNVDKILERQESVQDLIGLQYQVNTVRTRLKTLPDIERLLAKIFTYSIKHRIKAIYFEDVSLKKLTEFRQLLTTFGRFEILFKELLQARDELQSSRLKQLLTPDSEGGLIPAAYEKELGQFQKLIVWKKVPGTDKEVPEPQAGLDADFDSANERVSDVKEMLTQYLEEIRKEMKCRQINFSHAKFRYELEVPEELVSGNKKPKHFEFTSARKGFQRFHTPDIKELVDHLESAEETLKDAMVPFLCAIFTRFHEKKEIWSRLVSIMSELDCLMSLAITSSEQ